MTQLRDYQQQLKADIYQAWQTQRNVLAVSPTGSGKTVLFSDILSEYAGASCAIAHRQELVSQMSLALARCGVRHGVIAPSSVTRNIISIHIAELGRSYYDSNARCRVAGVDTLIRMEPSDPWLAQVGLVIQDEAHHVLKLNKWGRAAEMFPNARMLGVTATPCRADGKGLGQHAAGVFDAMIEGPSMRSLIDRSYLTDYRVFAKPARGLNLANVPISAGGDFSPDPLRKAVHSSAIVGDVVQHYLRYAAGKLGVTFAVDIEHATEIAVAYRAHGVPAEVITSKTPDHLRISILRQFRARQVMQLVNVDLFGEGFDLPAIEVVSFARPTQSFALYVQQFGRALRLLEGKLFAIIIDHVGNVERHRLPDAERIWSLDGRNGRNLNDGVIPVRGCLNCSQVYEAFYARCPYCKHSPERPDRSAPETVDGHLEELDPVALAALRQAIHVADRPALPAEMVNDGRTAGIRAAMLERQRSQQELRYTMSLWGGWRTGLGDPLEVAQARFYHLFGIDVLTAQALPAKDAQALRSKLLEALP